MRCHHASSRANIRISIQRVMRRAVHLLLDLVDRAALVIIIIIICLDHCDKRGVPFHRKLAQIDIIRFNQLIHVDRLDLFLRVDLMIGCLEHHVMVVSPQRRSCSFSGIFSIIIITTAGIIEAI